MINILLVDDDNINLTLLELFISQYLNDKASEYKIYKANNGKEALEIYNRFKLDLIVTDIRMPIFSGEEMIKAIRKKDLNIKIALITAYKDHNVMETLITEHINCYLKKPLTYESVVGMIEKILYEMNHFRIVLKKLVYLPQNYIWNFDLKQLTCNNKEIQLTVKEKNLLTILLKNQNQLVIYSHIKDTLWRDDFSNSSRDNLKTIMKNLRKKLPKDLIQNVYGLGYTIANSKNKCNFLTKFTQPSFY